MSNKNKHKAKKGGKSALTLFQEILGVVGGFVGSIMVIYGFIKTFRDDVNGFTWLLFLGGAIWLYVIWQMFQMQKVYAYIFLALTIVGGVVGWLGWQGQVSVIEKKVVVLVAQFDGPEDQFHLRDEILKQLKAATNKYKDTEIVPLEEIITVAQGSEYARKVGDGAKADLVIWGWYTKTEKSNLNLYIENLTPKELLSIVSERQSYERITPIADFESIEIQHQLGLETSSLVLYLSGLVSYKANDYTVALKQFEEALRANEESIFIEKATIYESIGDCHLNLYQYEDAVKNYTEAIQIKPDYANSYINRGVMYDILGKYNEAIQDYSQVIQLNPDDYLPYSNRGAVYGEIGQLEQAMDDYAKAIQLNPEDYVAFMNRGIVYAILKQWDDSLASYDQAAQLNPDYADIYYNRGKAYQDLGQYEKSILDYNRAIQLNPYDVDAVINRGAVYAILGQFDLAIADFTSAIRLNPNIAESYNNRGIVYRNLGKTVEAEADFAKYKELIGQDAP